MTDEDDTHSAHPSLQSADAGQAKGPIVFVHIPKTAGTSIIHYMMRQIPEDQFAPVFVGDFDAIGTSNPAYRVFWGHFFYSKIKTLVPNGFYMTFLRDPYARALSQYKSWHNPARFPADDPWRAQMTAEEIADIELAQKASFDEFVLAENPRFDSQLISTQTVMLSDHPYGHPDMLASAKKNLELFDFVGLVERFDESLSLLRSHFPEFGDYALPTESENRGMTVDGLASDAARDRLEKMLMDDIELYEHGKALFEKNTAAKAKQPASRGDITFRTYGDGSGVDKQVFDGEGNWLSVYTPEGKALAEQFPANAWALNAT